MSINWKRLVDERNVWVAYNFPETDDEVGIAPLRSIQGVMEELGELSHAHLKQVQSIRGDDATHEANAKDAIGDLTVYLLGVMSKHGKLPQPVAEPLAGWPPKTNTADGYLLKLGGMVGALCRHHLRGFEQGVTISLVVHYARKYCEARGWDYEAIVQETWDAVKQRDWIKYPNTGLPPAVEAA